MGDKQATILIVDDEDLILDAHSLLLEALGYEVVRAEDGRQAEDILHDKGDEIELVVTDVLMPNMNGYDLCKRIRQDEEFSGLPVMFVTALDTLDEKIKGYEAGGNDYIVKPLISDELDRKIKTLLKINRNNEEFQEQLDSCTQAAMQAMTYSSDLGRILEFYNHSLTAPDFETIAKLLFEVTDSYGLKCLLQVYTANQTMTYAHQGQASPLEVNVMELARGKARFLDFGARTIINYQDFSLLVKNMPLHDKERYGTLKDSLGNLCNAIEARIAVILSDDAQERKKRVLSTIRSALDDISADFNRVQKDNITAIEDMMVEVDQAFLSLGLSEPQEENIQQIVKKCLTKTNETYYSAISVSDRFDEIHARLKAILG